MRTKTVGNTSRLSKGTARYGKARRRFLGAGVVGLAGLGKLHKALADDIPPSWTRTGAPFSNYGQPVDERRDLIRWITANTAAPGDGVSWTPLHLLEGTITPNGLHFERHHNGVPALTAANYRLTIDGLVDAPLRLSLTSLLARPMQSRTTFIECGGNSNSCWLPTPRQAPAGYLHGLASCAEWTGVPLRTLLNDAELKASGSWLIVEGYDSGGVTVSLPMQKALDDTLVALYQNGEPLRAENGYPARLLVPGWEGIVNVKWLKRLHVADRPVMSRFDTVSYTDRHPDGTATRFSFVMGVKSVITRPSPAADPLTPGMQHIGGLAWSGAAPIEAVELSDDGGRSWRTAQLQSPVLDRSFTRFRLAWEWRGEARTLLSRARDAHGDVQPSRQALLAREGPGSYYHYNAMLAWSIDRQGLVRHVYV